MWRWTPASTSRRARRSARSRIRTPRPRARASSRSIRSAGWRWRQGCYRWRRRALVAGTYPKVTVDAKGRVTGGTTLVSGDIPAHTHVATDIVSGALPFTIQKPGTAIGTRRALNLIEGANITLTVADDSGNDRVNRSEEHTSELQSPCNLVCRLLL